MKKSMTLALLFCASTSLAACDDEKLIPESELPALSRAFLKTHFNGVGIASIVMERDDLTKDYTVWLNNGFEIDFERSGEWDEVDGHTATVPSSVVELLPPGIAAYVTENFTGHNIVKVNRELYGFEIGVRNAGAAAGASGTFELKFSPSGQFIGIDD